MIRLTRRYRFAASHRLDSVHLSERENRELYGKCNYPHGHGHDYVLEVAVRGPRDGKSGLAVDRRALDRLVQEEVLEPFDRRNLNLEVAAFEDAVPTAENLAIEVRRRLEGRWRETFGEPGPRLESIRIFETKRNIVELSDSL
jgi:6-pyruvoyltetrahydropterin/6-carboxytetrahydropterin synthase